MRLPVLVIGRDRVVVDLDAGEDGHPLVEQLGQQPEDARLGLAAQAEEEQVVLREDGVDDLRDDRVAVADDAGEQLFAGLELADDVAAQLVLDRHGR